MTQLVLIFIGGFLGSSHCLGMCGPLALALGSQQKSMRANVARQLVFTCGRILTYSFAGAVAAFGGWWMGRLPGSIVNAQAVLSISAGIALVLLGLHHVGWLRLPESWRARSVPCLSAKWLRTLLAGPNYASALLAGVFTGFIPCGLVYAFLAYAASTGQVLQGWLTMIAFGFGTAPLMVLTGCGGAMLSHSTRARALRVAAWCVIATGVISIARGAGHINWLIGGSAVGCPFCK